MNSISSIVPIPNYPDYGVTKTGEVYSFLHRSKPTPYKLKLQYVTNRRRIRVTLRKYGKRCTANVHRLVAEVFIPNPNNYPDVLKRNDNHRDVAASNLYWGVSNKREE